MLSVLYWINEKTLSNYFVNIISNYAIEKQKEETDKKIFIWKTNTCRELYISKYSNLNTKWYFNKNKLWSRLCIDEKNINWEVFTIFSNPDLKEWLIWMIPWVKSKLVTDLVCGKTKLSDRLIVKELSLDMASSMEWIARELFPQATQVVDRFHVMKNVLWDIQAVRIRVKTQVIKEELDLETQCRIDRVTYVSKKYNLNSRVSETKRELITRLRYQLFKRKIDWSETQINRWSIIKWLEEFQDIIYSYEIVSDLFDMYDQKDDALSFQQWFSKISKFENIIEMQNSWRMVQNHLVRILAYFNNWFTNAFAENLNSRIQRFVSDLRWFKDHNYMLYRIITKFSWNF